MAAQLAALILLGAAAQWIAWRLSLPSILMLIVVGLAAGPGRLGLVDPDAMFGETLFPIVAFSVAIILLEGGLTLRLQDIADAGRAVGLLVTLGAGVTWGLTTLLALATLDLDLGIALLLGAILVVTGPTVIGPMIRQIRPTGRVGAVLEWEGIVIDPIGAVLAVLVLDGVLAGSVDQAAWAAVLGIGKTLLFGGVLGVVGAVVLVEMMRRFWLPDHLTVPFALALGVGVFFGANLLQREAGLLSVTLMGVILANQRKVPVRQLLEFKENVRVLLISSLFILMSARIELNTLLTIDPGVFPFVLGLIFVVRPLAVLASTARSRLTWRERAFVAWMAPRGIVAAAVASIFALRLETAKVPGGEELVPIVFLVIVVTVVVYGLTAGPLARRFGLAVAKPQGVLMLGAQSWVRELARVLRENGVHVLLVDTNRRRINEARLAGLPAKRANVLDEHAGDHLDLAGLGRLAALTTNDGVNSLAAIHFRPIFGRGEVYQLPTSLQGDGVDDSIPAELTGRFLFAENASELELRTRIRGGHRFAATKLTAQFDFKDWRAENGEGALPLATIGPSGTVRFATVKEALSPSAGETLIGLVPATTP